MTRPRRYLSSRVFSRLDSAGCGLAESPDATCSYCDTFSSDRRWVTGWVSRRPGVALSQRPTGTRVGEPALESPLSTAPRLLSRSFRKFLAGSGEATYAPCSLPETTFFSPPSQSRLSCSRAGVPEKRCLCEPLAKEASSQETLRGTSPAGCGSGRPPPGVGFGVSSLFTDTKNVSAL